MTAQAIDSIRKNGRELRFVASRNSDFWRKVEDGSWEPDTFAVLDRFVTDDCVYIDIGAWIGPTVLYAAQSAGRSLAFEPDPVAFEELEMNVRANGSAPWATRLTIFRRAIGRVDGTVLLGSRGAGGDSMSSTLFPGRQTAWEVESMTLETLLTSLVPGGRIFVKMDIEGGEYDLVPALSDVLSKHDITLYLSLHRSVFIRSLRGEERAGPFENAAAKIRALKKHLHLIRSLPFRYFYTAGGVRIRFPALFAGRSVRSLVLMNRKW